MSTSPFPGMDPYLEAPERWADFHHALAERIKAALNGMLGESYFARVEVRTVWYDGGEGGVQVGYPDVAILRDAAAIYTVIPTRTDSPVAPIRRPIPLPQRVRLHSVRVYGNPDRQLVTAIEILSPVNKTGSGLEKYQRKRVAIFSLGVNLVEIDLLRGGERPGSEVCEPPLDTDYILLVNRPEDEATRISDIWPVALNEPLPIIPIPLRMPDSDLLLDLGQVVRQVYQEGAYGREIDYRHPVPAPRLRPAMQEWLEQNPVNPSS